MQLQRTLPQRGPARNTPHLTPPRNPVSGKTAVALGRTPTNTGLVVARRPGLALPRLEVLVYPHPQSAPCACACELRAAGCGLHAALATYNCNLPAAIRFLAYGETMSTTKVLPSSPRYVYSHRRTPIASISSVPVSPSAARGGSLVFGPSVGFVDRGRPRSLLTPSFHSLAPNHAIGPKATPCDPKPHPAVCNSIAWGAKGWRIRKKY